MQVVHDNSGVTHAVLGKGETIDFRASTSAQVLFLLSTGLYKYPRLAAVREIICNGWDSHIKSGIRHKPLSINISSEGVLSVRDYGEGIAHEDIGPIYCTAGDSTKVQSEEETGGFGLGSKAPFAYRDHFTVISSHGGKRTMYAMAMSDSQSMGKPTAKVLHTGTTDSSGIEVQLQLKPDDIDQFEKIIRCVTYLGDINATFNGELMDVCGMDKANSDMSVINKKFSGNMYTQLKIGIRYGAVVYPLELGDDFRTEFNALQSVIRGSYGNLESNMLVLRAPAGSVSMVPSREALLYNPRTTKTVVALINMAINKLHKAAKIDPRRHIAKIISKAVIRGWDPSCMLATNTHTDWPSHYMGYGETAMMHYMAGLSAVMPIIDASAQKKGLDFDINDVFDSSGNAHTEEEYSLWYVANNFRSIRAMPGIRQFYEKRLWDIATKIGNYNMPALRAIYKDSKHDWRMQRVVRKYINKPYLRAVSGLMSEPHKRLFAFETRSSERNVGRWVSWDRPCGHIDTNSNSVFNKFPSRYEAMIDLAQPLFVLVWDDKMAPHWARSMLNSEVTNQRHSFGYYLKLKRGVEDPKAIHNALLKNGWTVVDRTEQQGAVLDQEKEERRIAAAERRAKIQRQRELGKVVKEKRTTKNSIAALSNVIYTNGSNIDLDFWQRIPKPVMITDPRAIMVRKANKNNTNQLDGLSPDETLWLMKKYKDVTGITNLASTEKRFIENGAKPFSDMVIEDLMVELKTNPRILQSIAENIYMEDQWDTLKNLNYRNRCTLKRFLKHGQFRSHLGLITLTPEEIKWIALYEQVHNKYSGSFYRSGSALRTQYPLPEANAKPDVMAKLTKADVKDPGMFDVLDSYRVDKLSDDALKDVIEFVIKFTNL